MRSTGRFDSPRLRWIHRGNHAPNVSSVVLAISIAFGAAALGAGSAGAAAGGGGAADAAGVISFPYDLTAFGGARLGPDRADRRPTSGTPSSGSTTRCCARTPTAATRPAWPSRPRSTDPQTIVVELKPNIKFSDGTPLDADAVKFSIERTIAAKNVGVGARRAQRGREHHRRQPDQAHDQAEDPDRGPVLQPARAAVRPSWCRRPRCRAARRSTRSRSAQARSCSTRTRPRVKAVFKKNPNYFEKNKIKLEQRRARSRSQRASTRRRRSTRCSTASPTHATVGEPARDRGAPAEAAGSRSYVKPATPPRSTPRCARTSRRSTT